MMKKEKGIRFYVVILIVLLILYYMVRFIPVSKTIQKRTDREVELSENIKTLKSTSNDLKQRVTKDKDAINNFFFNEKTSEKLEGLLDTYPTDRSLKINDNLTITLQKEGNPIRVKLFDSVFELTNTRFRPTDEPDAVTQKTDVSVIENPNGANHYQMIHHLRTYLVESYGQIAFDSFLDKAIEEQIKENNELIDWIDRSYIEMEKLKINE